jgi:hypothetical protein
LSLQQPPPPQQQQQEPQDEPQDKLRFLSKCILGGIGESGFIALGQQFLGYGDSEEKAKTRAITGKYEKEDQGKIPTDYYVIDIINDEVGTQLKLSDNFFDKKNLIIIGYKKPGASKRKAQIFELPSTTGTSAPAHLARLIDQIRASHHDKLYTDILKSNSEERLTKCLSAITNYEHLLKTLSEAAHDTRSENVKNIVVSTVFTGLMNNISKTKKDLEFFISKLSSTTSSTISTTNSDLISAEGMVITTINLARFYINGITKAIEELPTNGNNSALIGIVKNISSNIRSQVDRDAHATAADADAAPLAALALAPPATAALAPPATAALAPPATAALAPPATAALAPPATAAANGAPLPPTIPNPSVSAKIKNKDFLQKKLNDVLYCKDTLLQLQSYKNLSKDIETIFNSPLFKDWITRYALIKDKLTSIISRLDANDSTSVPTDAELTKDITDVRELLSTSDIFKTQIIDVIEKLDGSVDSADVPLIKVAKLLVAKIKKRDEAYKEMSVDSTTTDMATVVEEAETVKKKVDSLVKNLEELAEFYKKDVGTVDKGKLDDAKQRYDELEPLVKRVNECYKSSEIILGKVSIFDEKVHSDAQKLVNDIQKIMIEINIAAAKGLATLVVNMLTSAEGAADAAIATGKEVTGDDVSVMTVTRDRFIELTAAFENAFKAYSAFIVGEFNFVLYFIDCNKYFTAATAMVDCFKGDKDALIPQLKVAQ